MHIGNESNPTNRMEIIFWFIRHFNFAMVPLDFIAMLLKYTRCQRLSDSFGTPECAGHGYGNYKVIVCRVVRLKSTGVTVALHPP